MPSGVMAATGSLLLVHRRDASGMTTDERLAELGEILATGCLRYLRKTVAASAEAEAPCDDAVNSREKGVA